MIFILVKKDGLNIEKRVLSGDDKKNLENALQEQANNLDKEYIVYREDEKNNFDLETVAPILSDNQKTWISVKDKATDIEKLFAKVLDLERINE